jgi:hypothetical protein
LYKEAIDNLGGRHDSDSLNEQTMKRLHSEGASLEYIAALWGNLDKLPKEYITLEGLSLRDKHTGRNAFDLCFCKKLFPHIPRGFLTMDVLSQKDPIERTAYHKLAYDGGLALIPQEMITKECLMGYAQRENVYHIAAKTGNFECIPKKCIDQESLLSYDFENHTVLHILAQKKGLRHIPEEFLTEGNLLTMGNGWSVAHVAAFQEAFDAIPQKALTPKLLLCKNADGVYVISYLSKFGRKNLLPKLTLETLKELRGHNLDKESKKRIDNELTKRSISKRVSEADYELGI